MPPVEQYLGGHLRDDEEGSHTHRDQKDEELPGPVPLVPAHADVLRAPGRTVEEDVGGEEGAHSHQGEEEDGEVLEEQLVQETHVSAAAVQAGDPTPSPRAAVQVASERDPVDGRR